MSFTEIRIADLGVIDRAVLELGSGLSVITGETGAGKTMLLTGLGLILGEKADPKEVRTGAERAYVEGRLALEDTLIRNRVQDAGGELDDDELLISRSVVAGGRSRAFLGGRSVPQAVLGEIAQDMVTVHGQSDRFDSVLLPGSAPRWTTLVGKPSQRRCVITAPPGRSSAR